MADLKEKLQLALNSKNAIKNALIAKGQNVGDVFAEYATAIENIQTSESQPSEPILEDATFEENGTYTPSEGYDGFREVTVNVNSEVTLNNGEYIANIHDEIVSGDNFPTNKGDYLYHDGDAIQCNSLTSIGEYLCNDGYSIAPGSVAEKGDYICNTTGNYIVGNGLKDGGDCLYNDGDAIQTESLSSTGDCLYNDGDSIQTESLSSGNCLYNDGSSIQTGYLSSNGDCLYYMDGSIDSSSNFPTSTGEYLYYNGSNIVNGESFPTSDGDYLYMNNGNNISDGSLSSNGDCLYHDGSSIQTYSLSNTGDYLYNNGENTQPGSGFPTSDGMYIAQINETATSGYDFPSDFGDCLYKDEYTEVSVTSVKLDETGKILYRDNNNIEPTFLEENGQFLYYNSDSIIVEKGEEKIPTRVGEYLYQDEYGLHFNDNFPTEIGDFLIDCSKGHIAGKLESDCSILKIYNSGIVNETLKFGDCVFCDQHHHDDVFCDGDDAHMHEYLIFDHLEDNDCLVNDGESIHRYNFDSSLEIYVDEDKREITVTLGNLSVTKGY